jgi:adenylosuccinate lyase
MLNLTAEAQPHRASSTSRPSSTSPSKRNPVRAESQEAIRAFLGIDYQEVAKLLAAGAKRIEQLDKWLDLTDVERVNLPSVSITLQPLKPSCR